MNDETQAPAHDNPEAIKIDINALGLDALLQKPDLSIAEVKPTLTGIPCCKPRTEYFRTMPAEDWIQVATIWRKPSISSIDETFIIIPPQLMTAAPDDLVQSTIFVPYETREKNIALWPIKLGKPDRKANDWTTSAIEVAQIAVDRWVRLETGNGRYNYRAATGITLQPTFGGKTKAGFFELGLKKFVVESSDDTNLRILRGEE